ncbi:unnamed protein product [Closterium sp. Naga37s-1]|nr:unnamed protein product [Closterium sp. Naga37s-1]
MLSSLAGVTVTNWDLNISPTFLGGRCDPRAFTDDDPHFRGADGTRYDFNGLLDRSFCLLSDRRIHINMGIKGYQPIANLPGTATSLDEESLAAALEAASKEKKPRHIRQLEQERLSVEELGELERMRANGSLLLTDVVVAALEREMGRRSSKSGWEEEQHSIQYAKHELKARLLRAKPIRIWISGGFKLLLAETRSFKGKDEDEFHLTIDGVVEMGITARLAHPLMQTATEAQAHFNVYIARLNHTNGIHGVLGQTFRAEESRKVRSLRYRLLTRLLREPVEVESESGRGFPDGRTEDYITSDIRSADCMFAAAWRRGEHENSDGSDFM